MSQVLQLIPLMNTVTNSKYIWFASQSLVELINNKKSQDEDDLKETQIYISG